MKKTTFLLQAAVIAAIYAALTLVLSSISYGVMQIRFSEALTVLPFFTPAAIPGLFIGCLIANLMSPVGALDIVIGSLSTLVAAALSYYLRHKPILVPLPPVLINGITVGWMLVEIYGVPLPLWGSVASVALGQFIACYVVGYPLLRYLRKYSHIFFSN